jgi:hypothetical protein
MEPKFLIPRSNVVLTDSCFVVKLSSLFVIDSIEFTSYKLFGTMI